MNHYTIRSIKEPSEQIESIMNDPDKKAEETQQWTISCRLKSNTNINNIDGTRGNNTVDAIDFLFIQNNFDWRIHIQHSRVRKRSLFHN